jgi:hypothetical protein
LPDINDPGQLMPTAAKNRQDVATTMLDQIPFKLVIFIIFSFA